jgi:hypothetical protein
MFRVKLYLIIVVCVLITSSSNIIMANSDHKGSTTDTVTLDTINGISLYHSRSEIVELLGIPQDINKDEWVPDMEEYRYTDLLIGFIGEEVQYIGIPTGVNEFEVDGLNMERNVDSIQSALGEPDFIADDGIVFVSGEACLKVFLSTEDARVIDAIHIYSLNSV